MASGAVPAHPGQSLDSSYEREAAQQKEIEEEAARRVHSELEDQSTTEAEATHVTPPYPVGQGVAAQ